MSEIAAYLAAEYFADGIAEPIRVGEMNDELEALLAERGFSEWCFITAWNPMSVVFPPGRNAARNGALRELLSEYEVIDGEGRDPKGEWEAEKSFLVLGISKDEAIRLARFFNQRAILYSRKGEICELIVTSS
jgi:hypothetical protein